MTATQDNLFDLSIQERFEQYHIEHPEVYAYLIRLAREVRGRGFIHYGVKTLWERLRWHFQIEKGDEEFKLNNNFHSRYARKLMRDFPDEFGGFFETRELRS